jgi:hypothetical protein
MRLAGLIVPLACADPAPAAVPAGTIAAAPEVALPTAPEGSPWRGLLGGLRVGMPWAEARKAAAAAAQEEGTEAGLFQTRVWTSSTDDGEGCTYLYLMHDREQLVAARIADDPSPCGALLPTKKTADGPSKVDFLEEVLRPGTPLDAAVARAREVLGVAPTVEGATTTFRVPDGDACRSLVLQHDGPRLGKVVNRQDRAACGS